jgi:hypothetical protein
MRVRGVANDWRAWRRARWRRKRATATAAYSRAPGHRPYSRRQTLPPEAEVPEAARRLQERLRAAPRFSGVPTGCPPGPCGAGGRAGSSAAGPASSVGTGPRVARASLGTCDDAPRTGGSGGGLFRESSCTHSSQLGTNRPAMRGGVARCEAGACQRCRAASGKRRRERKQGFGVPSAASWPRALQVLQPGTLAAQAVAASPGPKAAHRR